MAVTRRSVLLQGSAIGAGLVAANMTGVEALAQQAPRRRSISELSPNDPIVEAYREGVARLREGSGRVTWASIGAIHGNRETFNRCPHGSWYFLPWHRAYLVMYENIIREITGMREFALPYWDWTRERTLPRVFAEESIRGRRNPLFEPSRQARGRLADENVGQNVMDEILREANFEVFGSSRPRGQNNTDASWVQRRTGNQGPLEANPHNNVHGYVGGMMASSASAGDPIFWLHHCNVDRVWTLWNAKGNQNTTDRLWRDMTFRDHFFDPQGRPYPVTVRDLESTERLGYVYDGASQAASQVVAQRPNPAVQRRRQRFVSALERLGNGETRRSLDAAATGTPVFTADNRNSGEVQRPLAVPVRIDREVITRSFSAALRGNEPDEPATRGNDRPQARGEQRQRNDDGPVSMEDLARRQRGEYGQDGRREEPDAYGQDRRRREEPDQYGQDRRRREEPDQYGQDRRREDNDRPDQDRRRRDEPDERADATAETPRAVAFIDSVRCSRSQSTQVRVFLDCDYLNSNTPISDDHYVGTFGFFGSAEAHEGGGHGGGGDHGGSGQPSVMVDLSETLQKLYRGKNTREEISVQLMPVPRDGEEQAGEVTPARISIAFV